MITFVIPPPEELLANCSAFVEPAVILLILIANGALQKPPH